MIESSVMGQRWLLILLLVFAFGCERKAKPAPEAAPAAQAEAAKPEQDAPSAERLFGTWELRLTDDQRRQIKIFSSAFSGETDPSTKLTPEEEEVVATIKHGLSKNPNDPGLKKMKEALDNMAASSLTISQGELKMLVGGHEQSSKYEVQTSSGDQIVLLATNHEGRRETLTVEFVSDDAITMSKDGHKPSALSFVRTK